MKYITQLDHTTQPKTGKHLTYEECCKIATYLEDKHSFRKIGCRLGHPHSTISAMVKRGSIQQVRRTTALTGKVYSCYYEIYCPKRGQTMYDQSRLACVANLYLNFTRK